MQKYQIQGIHSEGAKGPFAVYGSSPEDARRIAETSGITVSAVVLAETGPAPPVNSAVSRPAAAVPQAIQVARACPACGSIEYRKVRPEGMVTFTWDRKCKACSTRYQAPTPRWGAALLILAGFVLVAVAFLLAVALLLGSLNGPRALTQLPGGICFGSVAACLGVIGGLAVERRLGLPLVLPSSSGP